MTHLSILRGTRTTIPDPVMTALGLKEGDEITYEIDGDRVVMTRSESLPALQAAIDEGGKSGFSAKSVDAIFDEAESRHLPDADHLPG